MKKTVKICLIVFVCLLIVGWVFVALTWFNIEIFDNWWEVIVSRSSRDSNCWYKERQHNKKVSECNDKCVIVSWYSEHAFYERYFDRYGEKPKENCYKRMTSFGEYICSDFEYSRDFSYKYTWYNEWINAVFSSDVEKIKEYNECIRECWPMLEQPQCLH